MQDRTRDSDEDDLADRDYDVAALANNLSQAFRYKIYGNEDAEEVFSCFLGFHSALLPFAPGASGVFVLGVVYFAPFSCINDLFHLRCRTMELLIVMMR